MPKRPLAIVLITLGFILSPFLIILNTSIFTNTPVIGPYNIFAKLSIEDWFVLGTYFVCAVSVFLVRKWGWYAFMAASAFLIGQNVLVFINRPQYDIAMLILYNLALTVTAAVFFRRAVIAPFFNPRIRWWEQATRLKINIFMKIAVDGEVHEAVINDISASGVFVTCAAPLVNGTVNPVTVMCMKHMVSLNARVMRRTVRDGHPAYGLMFIRETETERAGLDHLLRDLNRVGTVNRNREQSGKKDLNARISPRFMMRTHVTVQGHEEDAPALLLDLSKGGCLIQAECARCILLGQSVRLAITCLNRQMDILAVSRWEGMAGESPTTGLSFVFENRNQRAELKAIMALCRNAGAKNRLADAERLPDDVILQHALKSPYRFVHGVMEKIRTL